MIYKKCNPEVGLPSELVKVDRIEASHRVAEMLGLVHHHGFITRVDLLHKRPLAMGNYEMTVEIRPVLQSNS